MVRSRAIAAAEDVRDVLLRHNARGPAATIEAAPATAPFSPFLK